jgi:hypothetical protein
MEMAVSLDCENGVAHGGDGHGDGDGYGGRLTWNACSDARGHSCGHSHLHRGSLQRPSRRPQKPA